MMRDNEDPFNPGHMSATIKSDGKDGTWLVFHGTPAAIRQQIVEVFGLTTDDDNVAPLYDLINEATRIYKSTGTISNTLGGRVVSNGGSGAASGSAWDRNAAGSTPPEAPVDLNVVRLTNAIEGATSIDPLKELYARNKPHFDGNAELFALWQAKGKSLSA